MIGTHTVWVYPDRDNPTGTYEDVSCLVDEISIQHGRGDTTAQPDASSATVNVTVGPGAPLPPEVDIGAWLVIQTHLAGTAHVRFVGRVTDMAIGWDDAGDDTPEAGIGQIVAVSTLADYGRRVVGDEPFPQELDGARVARVFALAGLVLDPDDSDPGIVEVIPRDIDRRAALEVAQGTANDAGGLVWATRTGEIRYADSEHRRGTPVVLDLSSCDVLVTPTWLRNLDGLVNRVTITYGTETEDPEGGQIPQPVYYGENPESLGRFGEYAYSATVELARLEDVTAAANLILGQNGWPVWLLQDMPLDMGGLSQAQTAKVLELEVHSLIRIGGLPATGPTPTSVAAWVEGWTERLAWGVHEINLAVSDYCRTAPPPRWNDVSPDWVWDTVDPAKTWDGASCFGPPTDLGVWDTVPATTRWDHVSPELDWDHAFITS